MVEHSIEEIGLGGVLGEFPRSGVFDELIAAPGEAHNGPQGGVDLILFHGLLEECDCGGSLLFGKSREGGLGRLIIGTTGLNDGEDRNYGNKNNRHPHQQRQAIRKRILGVDL